MIARHGRNYLTQGRRETGNTESVGIGCPNPLGLGRVEIPHGYKHAAPLGLNTSTLLPLCVKLSFHSCRLASIRGGLPLFTPHANMSPRWGFKTFGYPLVYKHAAPLGLNTSTLLPLCVKLSFHSCRLASIRGGLPLFTPHANMSPRWGFKTFGYPLVYKHAAPLGLNTSTLLRLCVKLSFHSCRLVSIRGGLPLFTPHANMSPRWGFKTFGYPLVYKHAAPLGLNTSTLLPLCVKLSFHSCRLASIRGGLPLFTPHANMSPRWGFKTFGYSVVYKHAAPLGLNTSTLLRLCVKLSFHSCRLASIRRWLALFTFHAFHTSIASLGL